MLDLYRSYFFISRRDLVSKIKVYNNVNQINNIRFLFFNFFNLKNKAYIVLGLALLYLLTSKKGLALINPRRISKKKFGCSLYLNKKDSFVFLEKFLVLNLEDSFKLNEGFLAKSVSKKGTFSFLIDDIFIFSELGNNDLFRFRRLKKFTISIIFSNKDILTNLLLLKSIGFTFKN